MTDEITQRPAARQQEKELTAPAAVREPRQPSETLQALQAHAGMTGGAPCPHCGTVNEPEAKYCATCGALLQTGSCPNCGADLEPDADFCETCHHYVRPDRCSFCGAAFNENDPYCPECGSPRGGIVCPSCHALNDFAFCKQCGRPLTEEASQMMELLRGRPDYQELVVLAREYNELQMQQPYNSDREMMSDQASMRLRERVLRLLAQDEGIAEPEIPQTRFHRQSKSDLDAEKAKKLEQIAKLLSQMAIPPQASAAKVRNYAMAQKPVGVRLAWKCNYKQALHSSPCGCAKPQMGGQWIILGHNSKQEIKDDK